MKRIILFFVSMALIVSALLCGYKPRDFIAGKGSGENQEIKSSEDFAVFLEDVIATLASITGDSATAFMSESNIKNVATFESEESTNNIVTEEKPTSATLIFNSKSIQEISSYDSVDRIITVDASAEYFLADDGRTIISVIGEMTFDTYKSSQKTHTISYVDAIYYISDDRVAIKFNDVSINGTDFLPASLTGEWIDVDSVSSDLSATVHSLISNDKETLDLMYKYITLYGEDAFDQKETKLVMNNEYLSKFVTEAFAYASGIVVDLGTNSIELFPVTLVSYDNMSHALDFSDPIAPVWEMIGSNVRFTWKEDGGTVTGRYDSEQYVEFRNINNTIVEFDESNIRSLDNLLK